MNTKNVENLNSIFENCSSLTFVPNISKWKLNDKVKKQNIFRGCNSYLSNSDISKWNINIPEEIKISSADSNSIHTKEIKSNSKIFEDIIKYCSIANNSSSLKDNNDGKSLNNNKSRDFPNNNDFYDNFYN